MDSKLEKTRRFLLFGDGDAHNLQITRPASL